MVTMKSVRFHQLGGPEVLSYEDAERPTPGPRQALIRVEATGVNFADVVRRRGDPYPMPTPLPYTPGGECVGLVEAVGTEVDEKWLGRRVFAFPGVGCYAEFVVVSQECLFDLPPGMDPVTGVALFVQGLSAALVLKSAARMAPGETVFVQGAAGGVGLFAVQLAKLYGAGMVIAAVGSKAKQKVVQEYGADLAVDYTDGHWPDEVRAATQGRGVDVVLEMTGGDVGRRSFELLAPFGRSVVYGTASRVPLVVSCDDLPPRNLSVTGFFLRAYLSRRDLLQSLLNEFGRFVEEGRLRIHTGGVFSLRDARQAHEAMESRASMGKLVLVP